MSVNPFLEEGGEKKKTENAVVTPWKLAGGVREQVEHIKLLNFLK